MILIPLAYLLEPSAAFTVSPTLVVVDDIRFSMVWRQSSGLPPDHANEADEPVLDYVPLAHPGWKMVYDDRHPYLVAELLELRLPEPHPAPVAPPPSPVMTSCLATE